MPRITSSSVALGHDLPPDDAQRLTGTSRALGPTTAHSVIGAAMPSIGHDHAAAADSESDAEPPLEFGNNDQVVQAWRQHIQQTLGVDHPMSQASDADMKSSLEQVLGEDFPQGVREYGISSMGDLDDAAAGTLRGSLGQSIAGNGSGGDWAFSTVRNAAAGHARANASDPIFSGGTYALHHKVPQAAITNFVGQLPEPDKTNLAAVVRPQMEGLVGSGARNASLEKLLTSMPPNLELGPASDRRRGDPGTGFDGTRASDGSFTPRSEVLNRVHGEMNSADPDVGSIIAGVNRAFALHQRGAAAPLSDPTPGIWEQRGNKFRKTNADNS